jgi:threonyl-tRNA synthetase
MVHRAICGSLERFRHPARELFGPCAAVVRACAGRRRDDHFGRRRVCDRGREKLKAAGLSAEVDLRNEKINYKVREHSLAKVPVLLVCGRREAEEATVNIRRLGSRDQDRCRWMRLSRRWSTRRPPPDVKRRAAAA